VPPYDYGISNGTATKRITNTKKKMTKAEKIELLKKLRITV
jgi:hypothetical protein